MSANHLSLNQSKTEFLLIGLPKQLSEISDPALLMPSNVTITPTDAARNLGVIFDSSLTMSDHISSMSKSYFLAIRDLRIIRITLDFTIGSKMIARQVSCPSGRLPVMKKTFARHSFVRHVKDVCPSGCLPVSRLLVQKYYLTIL